MKIKCPKCQTTFSFNSDSQDTNLAMATCPNCTQKLKVKIPPKSVDTIDTANIRNEMQERISGVSSQNVPQAQLKNHGVGVSKPEITSGATLDDTEDESLYDVEFAMLPAYYRDEFTKIRRSRGAYKGKWNWAAFLFTWIWGLTKGVWTPTVIVFLAILFPLPPVIRMFFLIVYYFILGKRGNWMYYNAYVKKQKPWA